MSDDIWVAVIGGLGAVIGAVATVVAAKIQAAHRPHDEERATPISAPGIDAGELRILRALFGESRGRLLEGYKDPYHRPFLEKLKQRGWVEQIDKRYYLTTAGAKECRHHLDALRDWQPPE